MRSVHIIASLIFGPLRHGPMATHH